MRFSRQRLVLGMLVALVAAVSVPAIWLGIKWNHALSNVNKMMVAPVELPTDGPAAQPTPMPGAPAKPVESDVPEVMPTAIPAPDGALNILLLGTDGRAGDQADAVRTDTLVLVHLDGRTDHVSMLSFPRDLWVNVPGFGKNKINAAFSVGERRIGPGYGPALLKKTVSELTGLPVDRFVMINFQGFKKVIDTVGGIYVDVPKVIDDDKYPMDEYPGDVRTMKIHFDPGRQLMDGDRALIYARTRHQDSDFGRNQRQQQVLMALFDRIRQQGLLGQLTSIDQYTEALSDYVRTDLSRGDMLSLASMASNLSSDSIQRYSIGPGMVAEGYRPIAETPRAYVLLLTDRKAFKQMVNEMVDPTLAAAGGETKPR